MRKERDKLKIDGEKLRSLREKKGLSQDALVSLTKDKGISVCKRTISRIENGFNKPQLVTIRAIAQALDVEIESLCVSTGKKKQKTSSRPVFKYLRDFSGFVNERTQDFTGRDFVFDAVDNFLSKNDKGYFFIKGAPGIGKSAIASELVSRGDYIHHFNIRAEGRNKPRQFLENVCSQLILDFRLDYEDLPIEKLQDGELLQTLLQEVSHKIKPSEKVIIIIDALDEVDDAMSSGANILYLPMNLPEGIFIVATTRLDKLNLRIDCIQGDYTIDPMSKENKDDIGEYLRAKVSDEGIRSYIKKQKLTQKSFVEHMKENSQGNFMYLHYVLPAIEAGAYKDLQLNRLPVGLQNYYEDHWSRMKMMASPPPKVKLKIIYILCEVVKSVSRQLIADFGSEDEATVQNVLDDWSQFLHKNEVDGERRFSLYHESFRDFLRQKDIVEATGTTLPEINKMIGDNLYDELYDDG
jgi:transcriptional regulator with XRE-family HTH domain